MEYLLARWIEIENHQGITDAQGNIIGMEARFRFLQNKNVIVGGRNHGKINQIIELEKGTHTIRLSAPYNFSPKNMKIVLANTTALSPMEVRFEKI